MGREMCACVGSFTNVDPGFCGRLEERVTDPKVCMQICSNWVDYNG